MFCEDSIPRAEDAAYEDLVPLAKKGGMKKEFFTPEMACGMNWESRSVLPREWTLRDSREDSFYPRGKGNVQESPWFSRTTICQISRSVGSIGSGRG